MTEFKPEHDCPWSGPCGCVRDGSLCACGHQLAYHRDQRVREDPHEVFLFGGEQLPSFGECEMGNADDLKWGEICACERFTRVTAEHLSGAQQVMPEMEAMSDAVATLSIAFGEFKRPVGGGV